MRTDFFMNKAWLTGIVMILICAAAAPSFAGSANNANKVSEQQFFESLNDLPLMPGLYEMIDESVVFDKPGGRIIESTAASEDLAGEEIRRYYEQTLPQMGWTRIAPEAFVRQDEALTMEVEKEGRYNIVRFTVAPR